MILYPLIINGANRISAVPEVGFQNVIYIIQIFISFLASSFFLFLFLHVCQKKISRRYVLLISAIVTLNPLVLHFSLSVMTDSLASSLTVLFLSFLLFAVNSKDNMKICIYFSAATLFFVLLSLVRGEKLYLGMVICLVFLGILFSDYFRKDYLFKITIVFCICAMVIAFGCVDSIKKETQIFSNARPPLNLWSLAFNRIVRPRMSLAYDYFSEDIKASITREEAEKFDEHANNVYPLLSHILSEPDGENVIKEVTLVTVRHFPLQVIGKSVFDFVKYSLPNLMFPFESWCILPPSVATEWT